MCCNLHLWTGLARGGACPIAAQALHFKSWAVVPCVGYMSYRGHAARIQTYQSPIKIVLTIRGPQWALGHRDDVRRLRGNWPDQSRLLQLFWKYIGNVGSLCSGSTKLKTDKHGGARLLNSLEAGVDVKKALMQTFRWTCLGDA